MNDNLLPQSKGGAYWMVVHITHDLGGAHIVAGRLESEGIPAIVMPVAGASAMGLHMGMMGEVKVLVHPTHYDRALGILDADFGDAPALPDNTDTILFDNDDAEWNDDDEPYFD
jgi:hypothetical protein